MQPQDITLTFHGLGPITRPLDPGEDRVWLDTPRFHALLDAVAGRDRVAITFDDGNASDLELALPALAERGLGATFFVVAGRIGEPGFLDADGIRTLSAAGMRIGCHGMHHRPWRRLGERELEVELVDARRRIEDAVQRPVTEAACPFGAYDRASLRALRRGGYRAVYTSDRGTTTGAHWLRRRNTVTATDDPDLLDRIPALDRPAYRAVGRRIKHTVKRWR